MPEYIDPSATVQDTIQDLGLGNPRNTVLTFQGLSLVPIAQALTAPRATPAADAAAGPFPWWMVIVAIGVIVAFSKH